MSSSDLQIRASKELVELLIREFCENTGIGEPVLEWVPQDQDVLFRLHVTVDGPRSTRVLTLPSAPVQDRDLGRLARLVRNFVWQLTPDAP